MKKRILGTFISRFLTALLSFALIIVLSKSLGPEGKGEASLILATVTIILIFCDIVGGSALVYLAPRRNPFQLICISYLWSIIIAFLSWYALVFLNLIPQQYIIHTVLIALVSSLGSANLSILVAKEKIQIYNIIKLSQAFVALAILGALLYGFDFISVYAFVACQYIANIAVFLITLLFLPYQDFEVHFEQIGSLVKDTFRMGAYNQLSNLAQLLNYRVSYYILAVFWGAYEVGIYSNGVSIAESIWIFTNSICMVQYARISNSTDQYYNRSLTIMLSKVTMVVTLPPVIILYLLPPSFYQTIFGSDFGEMTIAIKTLAPGILLYTVSKVITHFFSGTGRYHYNLICTFAGLLVTLLVGFYWIPKDPLVGAGYTASISYLCTTILFMYFFIKLEKISLKQFLPSMQDFRLIQETWQSVVKRY
jgi:O-antigen/teichoic acid export membrane protein